MTQTSTIAIRTATEADATVLRTLAELDSKRPVQGPAVVALVDGRPVAAASLSDGSIVADPFAATADVVPLLRARAAAFAPERPGGRFRLRVPRAPRLRPAA
jgi:hypothetical protein